MKHSGQTAYPFNNNVGVQPQEHPLDLPTPASADASKPAAESKPTKKADPNLPEDRDSLI